MKVSRQASAIDLRANQKERTRSALIAAASELFRQGLSPTVADAAEHAKVSRATAYRYFPTQESLLFEVAYRMPALQPVARVLEELPAGDAEARLRALLHAFNPVMAGEEAFMRMFVRAAHDRWLENRRKGTDEPVREGRRLGWLDQVLEPVRKDLAKAPYRRLRAALSLTLGIDAIVVMKDVCGLEGKEALEVLEWAAVTLLRAGLDEAARPPRGTPKRPA